MEGARRLANEVRVGLEDPVVALTVVKPTTVVDVLDESWFGKPVRQHLREFGALFGALCLGVAALKLYRGQPLEKAIVWGVFGVLFGAAAYLAPRALHPLWKGWMKFAHYLSVVTTFILVGAVWWIGFVPMAMILKACGVKRMDMSYAKDTASYWEKREPSHDDFKRLEQQY